MELDTLSQGDWGSPRSDSLEYVELAMDTVVDGVARRLEAVPDGRVRGKADWKSLGCRGDLGGGEIALFV